MASFRRASRKRWEARSHPSSSWLSSYRVGAGRGGSFGSGLESQPRSTVASRGDELDPSGLEGALKLQESGKPHREKTPAELESLDRRKRYARLLGEFSLRQAGHRPRGPELFCVS